jgi:protein-L-isoaspartate(D-aspartate) O-methyltransferase
MDIAATAALFTEARDCMVDSQIRPNRVTDPCILSAMRRLPRERFLPPRLAALAYADEDVPLGHGRVLIEPLVIARLVQLAAIVEGERALVVAAGVGYGAALVAACGATVTALEEDQGLLALARSALDEIAPSVSLVSGPLAVGWPAGAPYDVILIEGAVPEIPAAFDAQVRRDGGRLVTVITAPGQASRAVLAEPSGPSLRAQPMFDCATPALPSLRRAPGFQF